VCGSFVADCGGDVMVYVDRNKMSQVIHNLVSNGLKFTPPGGSVSVTVTVERGEQIAASAGVTGGIGSNSSLSDLARLHTPFVKVAVMDTGPGLTQVHGRQSALGTMLE